MRALFLIVLAANLLFLAWARWIDSPRDAASQDSLARLPRLQLVTEPSPGRKPTSFGTPLPQSDALMTTIERTSLRTPGPMQNCTSVGPFNDITSAARAAGLLTQRGFSLRQRAEEGETIEGYWVFVDGMQSDDEVQRVFARLEKSGFTDAHVMKNYTTTHNRRVSVGMFTSPERAEKRAEAIRDMGLQPEIGERQFPGTVYWVDVAVKSGPGYKHLPPEYFFADIGHASVHMRPCPRGTQPGEPDAPTATPGDDGDGIPWSTPRTTVASAPSKVR